MADVYCFLCGANARVAATLEADIESAFNDACPGAPPPPKSSPFHFPPEDVHWQEDLVLLGPLDEYGHELVDTPESTPEAVSAIDVKSVRATYPIVPGDNHAYATVVHRHSLREYNITGNVFPFVHAGCFRIWVIVLEQSPRDLLYPERVLWAVVRQQNLEDPAVSGICGVQYGLEIDRTQMAGDFVAPLANIQYAFRGEAPGGLPPVILCCLARNAYPPNVVSGWWRGAGAMWIFSRPDRHVVVSRYSILPGRLSSVFGRFPLIEAYRYKFVMAPLPPATPGSSVLERVPVEILTMIVEEFEQFTDLTSLLLVSRSVRHKCLTLMDTLVRALAPEWIMPSLQQLKMLEVAGYPRFPWLKYVHYCRTRSPSMRNRWRIFGICQQVLNVAEQMTDEELGQLLPLTVVA
ncbi:hypothetical protein AURDEDRAFT_167809 [Auricularia subglabra TFB-10046 SS5]|nr:hypothetical protein AURDEDRAFT_167809 [Auricularia subglabra TFB-10046 SS5]